MVSLFTFIFGLALGSFLNVIINRLGSSQPLVGGRSQCPHCRQTIAWYDNIPLVSFILLRRKCRQCQKNISWQYPAVELSTALVLVWLQLVYGLSAQFFVSAAFAAFLVVIFVYDLKHYLILDRVSLPAMAIAFAGNLYLGRPWYDLVVAGVLGALFFGLQYILSRGRWVGGGDIRLGAVMGLMLGIKLLAVALFIAYISGAVIGLVLIAQKKKTMSSAVPFGPFLVAATMVSLVYGKQLLNWYLNLLY